MSRYVFFAYGLFCHGLFLATYAWMAAFVGNFHFGILPTMDGDTSGGNVWVFAFLDFLLLAGFAVPHSVMARPAFKRWWTRYVPPVIERSTYVLVSCLLMILLMSQWRPLGGVVWDVQQPAARFVLYGLFAIGWLMVPAVSLLLNHFDLFGTRQVWLHLRGQAYQALVFRAPGVYRFVRHPLYVGWIIAFWATPTMTAAHLLFALALTAYMLIAIPFEERDLVGHLGERYERYRRETGALVPRFRGRGDRPVAPAGA